MFPASTQLSLVSAYSDQSLCFLWVAKEQTNALVEQRRLIRLSICHFVCSVVLRLKLVSSCWPYEEAWVRVFLYSARRRLLRLCRCAGLMGVFTEYTCHFVGFAYDPVHFLMTISQTYSVTGLSKRVYSVIY